MCEGVSLLGLTDSGRMDVDVERRISQPSKAFGALRKAVFLDKNMTFSTKREVFKAYVMSVLLHGSECWTPLRKHISKLNSFHHKCIKAISNRQQQEERIMSAEVRRRWGEEETVTEMVMRHRLEWLGHVARMPDHRIPKLAWLSHPRPHGGPRRRWRDVVKKDLKEVKIGEEKWYDEARKSRRAGWGLRRSQRLSKQTEWWTPRKLCSNM